MAKAIREQRGTPRGKLSLFRAALYSELRFIAKHVHGFYGAVAASVTVSLLVGVAAVSIFAAFASMVTEGFTQAFDDKTLQWLEAHRSPSIDRIMVEVSALGTGPLLVLIVVATSVFLWVTDHRWSVYIMLLGVLTGKLLNRFLKDSFERSRPSVVEWVTEVTSLSFPSGHAMTSMITYGIVAYLIARLQPTRGLRLTTWALAAFMIVTIGFSRMYLGVHYPSDIIAGYLAGIAWIAFVATTLTAVRFFAPRRPETRKEEKDLQAGA